MTGPSNFAFLVEHSTLLADLGATAERLYPFDPSSCVLKLRLLAEVITRDIAARVGVALVQPTQAGPPSCSSAWPPAATSYPRPSEAAAAPPLGCTSPPVPLLPPLNIEPSGRT